MLHAATLNDCVLTTTTLTSFHDMINGGTTGWIHKEWSAPVNSGLFCGDAAAVTFTTSVLCTKVFVLDPHAQKG